MQRFTIHTLLDITETKRYRHQPGDELAKHQQQNFLVLLQTIGLRANPIFTKGPAVQDQDMTECFFGTAYPSTQRVWTFEFDIEYEGAFAGPLNDAQLLTQDLHFVPVIMSLTETIDVKLAVFDTASSDYRNTVVYTGL